VIGVNQENNAIILSGIKEDIKNYISIPVKNTSWNFNDEDPALTDNIFKLITLLDIIIQQN